MTVTEVKREQPIEVIIEDIGNDIVLYRTLMYGKYEGSERGPGEMA